MKKRPLEVRVEAPQPVGSIDDLVRRIDLLLDPSLRVAPRMRRIKESVETEVDGRGVTVAVAPFYCHQEVLVDHHTVSTETRRRILERDGEYCGLCADIFGPFEIDHRLPICRGGTHDDTNLWVLCDCCNRDKGSMTVEEFADLLARFGVSWLR